VLIEVFFSLGVTANALRAQIGDLTGSIWPKISGRRDRPPPTTLLLRKPGYMLFHMV